jgi:hypothetical protein
MQHKARFATGLAVFAVIAACAESPTDPTAASLTASPSLSKQSSRSGTTLSATKSAVGFREDRLEYDWTVKKSLRAVLAGPHMLPEPLNGQTTVTPGDPRWLEYRIEATRNEGARSSATGVRGSVCVTNGGGVATQGLAIVDVVQTSTGSAPYQDYTSKPVDVSAKPVLAPGESYCYPYEVAITPLAGAQYRNTARITITNHSGYPGQPFGPGAGAAGVKADFSIPDNITSVTRDASATLDEHLSRGCAAVFPSIVCTWENETGPVGPVTVTHSQTFDVMVDLYDVHVCGEDLNFKNVATLTENGPRLSGEAAQVRADSASLLVHTGNCAPKPINPGCTLTQGYWKNHAWPAVSIFSWDDPKWQFFDTGIAWKDMLGTAPKGDAYYILANQFIAATLNQQNGAYTPEQVRQTLADAYRYFAMPPAQRAGISRSTLTQWANLLDQYNNGKLGVPHCG